jgi:acetyl-CoA carboxylase biotin carboxyl carrier protein
MVQREEVIELLATIDRLERLLERSALTEIEIEADGMSVILRTPAAIAATATPPTARALTAEAGVLSETSAEPAESHGAHAVVAPLTGVYYRSPSPDAEPYVREGAQVSTGQVIGLIEAMKLFNEIKSDVTGVVRRLSAGDGDLVKARQTLIEVDPA